MEMDKILFQKHDFLIIFVKEITTILPFWCEAWNVLIVPSLSFWPLLGCWDQTINVNDIKEVILKGDAASNQQEHGR